MAEALDHSSDLSVAIRDRENLGPDLPKNPQWVNLPDTEDSRVTLHKFLLELAFLD